MICLTGLWNGAVTVKSPCLCMRAVEGKGDAQRQGKPGKGNISVWDNLFLAFLLPSPSPFFCLSLLGDDSHLLCPDTTISHQQHAVTLMSPKLFCVRSLHCLHLFFGVQDSNAVLESMPVTKHRLTKSRHPPMTRWCLSGIMGFWVLQPTGKTFWEQIIESSLCWRDGLYENPRQNIHQLTSGPQIDRLMTFKF